MSRALVLVVLLGLVGCDGAASGDGGDGAAAPDAAAPDAGDALDAGSLRDAGLGANDSGAGRDAATPDASAGSDSGVPPSDAGAGCVSPADVELTVDAAPASVDVDTLFEVIYRIANRGPARSERVLLVTNFTGDARGLGGSTGCVFGAGQPVFCSPGDVAAGESITVRVSYIAETAGSLTLSTMAHGIPTDTCVDDNELELSFTVAP